MQNIFITIAWGILNKIKDEEKYINEETLREYFNYQSPSFLVKDLDEDNHNKNDIIVKCLMDWFKKLLIVKKFMKMKTRNK